MERIKTLRKMMNITQADLAKLIGVKQTNVSEWENGNQFPALDNLHKLCKHLNTNPSYLLGYSTDPTMQANLDVDATDIAIRWSRLNERAKSIVMGELSRQEQLQELEPKKPALKSSAG